MIKLQTLLKEAGLDTKHTEIVEALKIHFKIAYETGLEAAGSYDDFDKEFWDGHKEDLEQAIQKALR